MLLDQGVFPFFHDIQEDMSVSGSPGLKSGVSMDQIIRNLFRDWSIAVKDGKIIKLINKLPSGLLF